MKRKLIAITLLLCMVLSLFIGCAEEQPYDYDLSLIVSLVKDNKKVYQGVEVYTEDIEAKLKEAIDQILYTDGNTKKHEQNKDNPELNATVADRDVVNIDYKGVALGKTLTAYTYKPTDAKELPTELKDKLVGKTIGEGSVDAPILTFETKLPAGLKNTNGSASEFSEKEVTVVVYKITKATYTVPATAEGGKETTKDETTGTVAAGYLSLVVDMKYTFKDPVAFSSGSTYTGKDGDDEDTDDDEPTGSDLTIGSNSFVDDFETELIGHKLGETVKVNVTFPATYGQTYMQNMEVDFETVINYLKRPEAKLTDAMAKAYCEEQRKTNGYGKIYETAKEYEEELRKAIIKNMVYEAVVKDTTVLAWDQVPELKEVYDNYWEQIDAFYTQMLSYSNKAITYNEFLVSTTLSYYLFGSNTAFSTPEQLAAYVYNLAMNDVKPQLALHGIAQKEGITVTDADYTAGVSRLFEEYKNDEIDTEKKFVREYGEENLRRTLLLEKVHDYLLEQAVEKAKPQDTGSDSSTSSGSTANGGSND